VRVAEHLLTSQDTVVTEHDVFTAGEVIEVDHAGREPLAVRVQGGELRLDLVVGDDATLPRVDEKHLAGLQTALRDDLGGVDVDHSDLGGHHDQVVIGHPVAAGTQAVAVEDGTDHLAVGERDTGRTVPRLHHRCMEPVEVTPLLGHGLVVLPRLGDHHQHGVVDRITAEVQQLEDLVESSGVGRSRSADRERPLDTRQGIGMQHRLAGAHPVLVALHRVDLPVVGDEPVRVGQRPRRERVRREPGMHQQQRGLDPRVEQVGEELGQLRCRQHSLVDDRARRQ
jgi:hypothetical protein